MSRPNPKVDDAARRASAALAARHRPAAFRIASAVLGDRDAAEDVAQDVMVRLLAAAPGFDQPDDLDRWVYRVTVNRCRDMLRGRRRRGSEVPLELAGPSPALSTSPDPGRAVDAEQTRMALRAALDRLPAEHREALTMRYLEQRSYAEIARLTATPPGTVASRLFRALKRLGEEIDPRHLEVLR